MPRNWEREREKTIRSGQKGEVERTASDNRTLGFRPTAMKGLGDLREGRLGSFMC